MDREAWHAVIHGVAKSWTWLSNWTEPKITADGDSNHEIEWCLLLGRKALTYLDSILKIRDITLPIMVHLVRAVIFPVVTYGCESWTIRKVECWWIDAFELWCWRDSWESCVPQGDPASHPEGNQSWISFEGLMLKLKLQYFGHLMRRNWLIGKDPYAGKDWRQLEKGTMEDEVVGLHCRLAGHEFAKSSRGWWCTGKPGCCIPWGCKDSDRTEQLVWYCYWTLLFFHLGHNSVSFHFGYLSVIVVLILEADGIVVLILSDCLLVVEDKRLVEASWWELPLCLLFGLRQPSPKVCRLL